MKTLDRVKLGNFITRLRRSRDLNAEGMGELLSVSGRTVRRWEKGEILPTMDDIITICNEFNISLEEFFEGEINLDKEINRKLLDVNANFEKTGECISSIDEAINSISRDLDSLKKGSTALGKEDLSWLWLLMVHLICTSICFIAYVMSRMRTSIAFLSSLLYIASVTWIMVSHKRNARSMKLILLYSILLGINLLINYVIFADVTAGVIINVELMIINGALYGLRIFDLFGMELLLLECMFVYVFWSIYCIYQIINNCYRKD